MSRNSFTVTVGARTGSLHNYLLSSAGGPSSRFQPLAKSLTALRAVTPGGLIVTTLLALAMVLLLLALVLGVSVTELVVAIAGSGRSPLI